ncbi:hypothetical protein FA13DRAFT_568641 [Coprinellus micaceus]|uniref:Uncharacterized protein n=1 Tax=Coprinellus micaceus TaxID=71717 RepID=A0A4Y7T974_COPMI|nr:hypothetical protein FA13DRAFT_568641 [Coprinellus micaceus]
MDDDPAARRRKLEFQELEEMQRKEQQSLPQGPFNNHPQQHFGRVPPQPGPSRLPSTNAHGQLNMQRVDLLPQNTSPMQLDPYQWQALCAQFGQNYAGAIYPYNTYHNPNSIPTNNSGLIIDANATPQGNPHSQQMPLVRQTQNVTNPNSAVHLHPHPQQAQVMRQNPNGIPSQGSRPAQKHLQQQSVNQNSTQQASAHPQQGQLVRQTQSPVPTQSLTPTQNSLQQQLSMMNQAYTRNAGAEYVPPSVESNLQQSNQQVHGPSQSHGRTSTRLLECPLPQPPIPHKLKLVKAHRP